MTKIDAYRQTLQNLDFWDDFLLSASGLPGPRGNLELAQVVAALGDRQIFARYREFNPQRAAAAALAEPALLGQPRHVSRALAILDRITTSFSAAQHRKSAEYKALKKGLAYCWSVLVAALPEEGKRCMEKWFACQDPDVRWVMKENLKKKRLERMDSAWVTSWREQL